MKEIILISHPINQNLKKPYIIGCSVEITGDVLILNCPNDKTYNELKNDKDALNYIQNIYNTKKLFIKVYKEEEYTNNAIKTQLTFNKETTLFKEEFITEPYFKGPSNEFAYNSIIQSIKSKTGIIVISGNVGVGKSHMLHRLSYKAYQGGMNVYINSTAKFISQIFDKFSDKKNYNITDYFLKYDLLALDDFQVIDKKHLVSNVHDIFFDILNSFIMYDKLVLLSCDRHPRNFEYIHKRIVDRLWGVRPVDDPDKIIMNKYIRWFKKKHNVQLKNFSEIILSVSYTMRMLKEFLYIAKFLGESNMLTVRNFEEKTKVQVNNIIDILKKYLLNYYNIAEETLIVNKKRSKLGTKICSIMYFLLFNKIDDIKLIYMLDISRTNKNYYFSKGKAFFEKEIKNTQAAKEIKLLLSNYDNIN